MTSTYPINSIRSLRCWISLTKPKRRADAEDMLRLLTIRESLHRGGLDIIACRAKHEDAIFFDFINSFSKIGEGIRFRRIGRAAFVWGWACPDCASILDGP